MKKVREISRIFGSVCVLYVICLLSKIMITANAVRVHINPPARVTDELAEEYRRERATEEMLPSDIEQEEEITVMEGQIVGIGADAALLQRAIQSAEPPDIEPEETEPRYQSWEIEELAACVEAEAGDQPLLGRQMVVDVILNRVDDADFPDTIAGVIEQPYHFSTYWDGSMERVDKPSELTVRAVEMEFKERSYPGLIYFRMGHYHRWGTPWGKIGDHYFSTK